MHRALWKAKEEFKEIDIKASSKMSKKRNEEAVVKKSKMKESLMINWLANRQIVRISMRHCDIGWVNK